MNREIEDKLNTILFESIGILGEDRKIDRTQEHKLFVDRENIFNFIQSTINQALQQERERIVEMIRSVTDYDHSKCPIKETCIGYQNCVSDIENGVIKTLNQ